MQIIQIQLMKSYLRVFLSKRIIISIFKDEIRMVI